MATLQILLIKSDQKGGEDLVGRVVNGAVAIPNSVLVAWEAPVEMFAKRYA